MNGLRVALIITVAIASQRVSAESRFQRLTELREAGASMCASGRAIVMTIGGKRWKRGNEGLAPLRERLTKSISFLNINAIDDKPLSKSGLSHIASAPEIQRVRFLSNSIDSIGICHFVKTANENPHRPYWIVFNRISITDDSLKCIAAYNGLSRLQIKNCKVSPAGLARLKLSLPDCQFEYSPPNGATEAVE